MDFLIYVREQGRLSLRRYASRDEQSLEDLLMSRGIDVVDLRRLNRPNAGISVSKKHLLQFFAKLRICCRIGMPIVDALKLCEKVAASRKFAKVIGRISDRVSHGAELSEQMWEYPGIFPPIVCRLIEVGTASGTLVESCDKVFYMLNLEMGAKRKVLGALYYPAIVMAGLLVAVYILVAKTIPAFLTLFEGSGVELPLPTRILMGISGFISDHPLASILSMAAMAAAICSVPKLYAKSAKVQSIVLKLPPFASLLKYSQRLSLCSAMYTMLGAGIPILSALRMARNSMSNVEFKKAVASAISSVYAGKGVSCGFSRHEPLLGTDMVRSFEFAETTGSLKEVLKDLRDEYEASLEYRIHLFKESINPLITAVIAVAVLFILLALFMPMFSMSQAISG